MYLEVVSVSMKSQCYEVPNQASVLLSGVNFSKQSKSIPHLDASTSKQWWMFKEVFEVASSIKEQKMQIKLYGSTSFERDVSLASSDSAAPEVNSSSPTSTLKKQQSGTVKQPLSSVKSDGLEICIGKLDLSLSALQGSRATSFDMDPVSLAPRDGKDKLSNVSILKRSISSTITLRLLTHRPPRPPSNIKLDTVAIRDKDIDDEQEEDNANILLGTVRVVVWQGKNLNTEYPVFLENRMNQKSVRRYVTLPVANPHNPIFDVIQDFDIHSLQGDLFISVVTDHSLRSNKPMGQVIIPLSMLTNHMVEYENSVSISGWFELFPHNKITKYNGGGKYVSYMSDIPLSSGIDNCIGLAVPEKSLGFIKLDVTLQLYHSLLYTIIRNPFCVEEKPQVTSVDEEDAVDLFDIYVTKHNFYRIMDTMTNPLWFKTFKDIIRWNHHFGITFFALYLYSYTCLLAEAYMFPFIFVIFIIFVGLVASYERNFEKQKLFVDEKTQSNKQNKVEEGNSKSLAERYKGIKQSVHKMEHKVRQLASQVEKINNLLLWSDSTLSITALFFLLLFTLASSLLLSIIPFNLCFFFGGLVVFVPQEAMGRLKKIKQTVTLLWQRLKAEYKIRNDMVLPEGMFLTQLRQSYLEETMAGHVLSGDLCSQTWSGTAPVPTASGDSKQMNKARWKRKWCELWAVPGVLKISEAMGHGEGEDKPAAVYDVTYVMASYIGKSSMKQSAGGLDVADSSKSDDDIYLFEISYLKGKKATLLKQVIWPNYETTGWVFGCSSFSDAQTWVKAINKVSYRVSFWSILSGEDIHNPFYKRRNRSIISKIFKTLWRWVMLVPDNWELQHRHFCDQAYVRSNYNSKSSSLIGKPSEKLVNNDMDVIQVSSKKNSRTTEAVRYLSVGYEIKTLTDGGGVETGDDSGPPSSGIHVSLFRARGLKVKSTQTKAKGWLLATTIPKIYVNLRLSSKEECNLELRTGGQPRSAEPVFREDFFFPDVNFDTLLEKNISLVLEVSVRTPMAFGLSSDYVQILGRIHIPLKPWIERKLTMEMSGVNACAETRNRSGSLTQANQIEVVTDDLDDVQWFNLISHTVIVGELQMQIACL